MSYLMAQAINRQAMKRKKTPQAEPIPGRESQMVPNNAGGFGFVVEKWARLDRFLILGSEGGSYYQGENKLTTENLLNVGGCLAEDPKRVIDTLTEVSVSGRAPKNDPALYVLAMASAHGDAYIRNYALAQLPKVARTGTHLFSFVSFADGLRGWGTTLKRAVAAWYTEKTPSQVAYQVAKYQQRNGWSHRDLLRLSHPQSSMLNPVFRWVVKGELADGCPEILGAMEAAKTASEKELLRLIQTTELSWEMLPSEKLGSAAVWEALLPGLPVMAMIRNLGRLSSLGLLGPMSEGFKLVRDRLSNKRSLGRTHPIQILAALKTYGQGCGVRGGLKWEVNRQILDVLDGAFHLAFSSVKPTGKNFVLGIDVSGSMGWTCLSGIPAMRCSEGAAAMAMLIAKTEPNHFIGGFADSFRDLGISASDGMQSVLQKVSASTFGGTNTSVAIRHAQKNRIPAEVFVIITDGETWAGNSHTCQEIRAYRQATGIDAKVVVMNMVANRTSIADPEDAGCLDVVGFDASVPAIINGFIGAGSEHSEE